MKKFVTMALSFLLTACVMVGCGRQMDNQTPETTSTTTHTTAVTMPTTSSMPLDTPEDSTMPSNGNGSTDENANRSRTHRKIPHMNITNR